MKPALSEAREESMSVGRRTPLRLVYLMERLSGSGLAVTLATVDGALLDAGGILPHEWHQARLETSSGSIILRQEDGHVAVLASSAAPPELRATQALITEQVRSLPDDLH